MPAKYKSITTILLIAFLVNSCSYRQYVTEIKKTGELQNTEKKTLLITSTTDVLKTGFEKTFKKVYSSDQEFVNDLTARYQKAFSASNMFSQVELDTEPPTSKKNSTDTNADYILNIRTILLTSKYVTGAPMPNGMASTSTEYAVVTNKLSLYDVANKTRILEYTVTGEQSVVLFNFSKTLNKAIQKMVANSVKFIKTGETR